MKTLFPLSILILVILLSFPKAWAANVITNNTQPRVVAYLGADSKWNLTQQQLQQMQDAFGVGNNHVSIVDYAFVRFATDSNGNTILNVTADDLSNLDEIRKINPVEPIIFSVGGWGARNQFGFLANPQQRQVFESSVVSTLRNLKSQGYNITGIDIDWENEQLASQAEIDGLGQLLLELRQQLPPGDYLSNAVPASPAYWIAYPSARIWGSAVNFTTVMAYDHYGTFGPKAEYGASLFDSRLNNPSAAYPYSPTSGNYAIEHYVNDGLPANKILLGMPFYCHSYYIPGTESANPLHAPVLDPNISSQVDYSQALAQYGLSGLSANSTTEHEGQLSASSYYALVKQNVSQNGYLKNGVYQFLSCDVPDSVAAKMAYVKGKNPMHAPLAGVSFWSLLQDVDYNDNASLLHAISTNLSK